MKEDGEKVTGSVKVYFAGRSLPAPAGIPLTSSRRYGAAEGSGRAIDLPPKTRAAVSFIIPAGPAGGAGMPLKVRQTGSVSIPAGIKALKVRPSAGRG